MFDGFDFFDVSDAAEAVSDVSEVSDFAEDVGEWSNFSDFQAVSDFSTDFEPVSEFSMDAAEASGVSDMSSLGFGEGGGEFWDAVPSDSVQWMDEGPAPGWDVVYGPAPVDSAVIYDTAIGPGLNGTPGALEAQGGSSFFSGFKGALSSLFSNSPSIGNRPYQRGSTFVSGRGGVPYQYGRGNSLARASYNDGSLFGRIRGALSGQPAPRAGLFGDDGNSTTTWMMVGGLALVAVALLAKR